MISLYIDQVSKFSTLSPVTVLEIGALDGQYSKALQEAFELSQENIYLVEPNPDQREMLENTFPAATRIYKAISNKAGTAQFNKVVSLNRSKIGSSSLAQRMDGWTRNLTYEPVSVDVITGKTVLQLINKPIDLCIIDVEGMTYEVLDSFGSMISEIKSLMIECEHAELFKNQRLYADVSKLLIENKFRQMAFHYSYANQSDSVWIQEKYVDLQYKYWPVPDTREE